jgi:hypothetical protein
MKPIPSEELARCDREIAEAEATLRSGYPDIDGCLLWLYDWRCERKLIEDEMASMAMYQKYCSCVRRPDSRVYIANNEAHCADCHLPYEVPEICDRCGTTLTERKYLTKVDPDEWLCERCFQMQALPETVFPSGRSN